ncbi:uncharacterized protein LOC143555251 isoform X2 [Bidens hawaiensis]|uniref:uncharacterized protein LOC143555251 isoform X2 n=1 Tax=Bidens hawaiensis TaxID=980011 RepID=UPI00404AF27C
MFLNRVANRTKLRRVVAPNVSKQGPTVTMSETNDGNKGAKRVMTLVDGNNDEDDDIFLGNEVDMEVDDANQDYEYNDVDNTIHSNDQHDIQMENHVNFDDEEQLQGSEKEKEACYLKGNSIGRRKRLRITSIVSNERTADHVEKDHVEDHRVFDTQSHETSEIQGASKNVRGYTQKAETWKMDSTQRIVVSFNKFGISIRDEGNELVQFLGTLVRMPDHVSMEHSDWRKVPIRNKEDMYSLVKGKKGVWIIDF